eukprot:Polyplicarium_translucidae@DN3051_c5_g1_i3.p1
MRESGDLVLAGYGHLATAFGLGAVLSLRLLGQTEPVGEEIEGPVPLDADTWNAVFTGADFAVIAQGVDMWGTDQVTKMVKDCQLTVHDLDARIETFLSTLQNATSREWFQKSVPLSMLTYRALEALTGSDLESPVPPPEMDSQPPKALTVSEAIQLRAFGPRELSEHLTVEQAMDILESNPPAREVRALAYRLYCRSAWEDDGDSFIDIGRRINQASKFDPVARWLVCDALTDWGWRGRVAKQKENLGLAFVSVPESEPEFLEWLRERPDRFQKPLMSYAMLQEAHNPFTKFDIHHFFSSKGASPIMLDFLRDLETGIMMALHFVTRTGAACDERDVREVCAGQRCDVKLQKSGLMSLQPSFSPVATLVMLMSKCRVFQHNYSAVEDVLKCGMFLSESISLSPSQH